MSDKNNSKKEVVKKNSNKKSSTKAKALDLNDIPIFKSKPKEEKSKMPEGLYRVKIEKIRLNQRISEIALTKSFTMYFILLLLAIYGLANNYFNRNFLNILIMMGIGILVIGLIPYVITTRDSKSKLNALEEEFKSD